LHRIAVALGLLQHLQLAVENLQPAVDVLDFGILRVIMGQQFASLRFKRFDVRLNLRLINAS
jgi:hypothetical protein